MDLLLLEQLLSILGLFLGIMSRAIIPFLRKVYIEGETDKNGLPLKWSRKYTVLIIFSLIITFYIFPNFAPPAEGNELNLVIEAFITGFGFQALFSEAVEWFAPSNT